MKTQRLKHLVATNQRALPENTNPDYEFNYIDIGSVGRGILDEPPQQLAFASAPSRARRTVKDGDTIISTVRTYLRAVWPVTGPTDDLVVSTGFAVLTPGPDLEPRYLGWLAQSDLVVEEVVARSVGVSYPAINATEIGDIRVPLPGITFQRAIADYLDAETSRIDALIEKKQRMAELIEIRLWTAVVDSVLSLKAPLLPIRRVLKFITDGPFGSAFSSDDYSDEGAAVIRLGNIGFGEYRPTEQVFLPLDLYRKFLRHQVLPGDVLIAGLGDPSNHPGRACVAPDLGPAMVKGKCFCARLDRTRAEPEYLALLLSSPYGAGAVGASGRGSTRTMINLEIIKETALPFPDIDAQRNLIDFARASQRSTESLRRSLTAQVSKLQEHRQALITAAVNGELDVPTEAA